jgi:hypothetical protein
LCILAAGLLTAALGCSTARQQTAATPLAAARGSTEPQAAEAATAARGNEVQLAAAQAPAYPLVPYHAVPGDPGLRRVSPRAYPIAVPPMRTYGCCH